MYTENPFPYCLALSTVHTISGWLLGLFTLYLLLITCNLYTYTWRLPLKPYDYVINLAKDMPNLFFQGRWCFWETPQAPPCPTLTLWRDRTPQRCALSCTTPGETCARISPHSPPADVLSKHSACRSYPARQPEMENRIFNSSSC